MNVYYAIVYITADVPRGLVHVLLSGNIDSDGFLRLFVSLTNDVLSPIT